MKEIRKAEKEQKDIDKKKRKEEEKGKAAEVKARKRLSRRPPAAMDTQRMSASLRASTDVGTQAQPPSESSSRSSSKEGRRSSIGSLKSFLGLSKESLIKTTPLQPSSMQDQPSVSGAAQPRGRLRAGDGHSRTASSETYGIAISDDEDHIKELVGFAYEVHASPELSNHVGVKKVKGVRISMPATTSTNAQTPPPSRSDDEGTPTETKKSRGPINFSRRPLASRRGSSEEGFFNKQKNAARADPGETATATKKNESTHTAPNELTGTTGNFISPTAQSRIPHQTSENPMRQTTPSSHDGGSYVHKQRMYQQQRSIAGYQDELAIEMANRPRSRSRAFRLGTPTMPPTPTPTDSAESLSDGDEVRAQKPESSKLKTEDRANEPNSSSEEDSVDKYHQYRAAESQKRGARLGRKVQGMPKAEKMLGAHKSDVETGSRSELHPRPNDSAIASSTPASKSSPATQDVGLAVAPARHPESVPETALESKDPKQRADTFHIKEKSPVRQDFKAEVQGMQTEPAKAPSLPRSPTDPILLHNKVSRMVEHFSGPDMATASDDSRTKKAASKANETKEASSQGKTTHPVKRRMSKELNTSSPLKEHKALVKLPEVSQTGSQPRATAVAVEGDSFIRKPSLRRPRSDPELKVSGDAPTLPTFDFLPELKHQPLVKPKRTSPVRVSFAAAPTTIPPSTAMASSSSSSSAPSPSKSTEQHTPSVRSARHTSSHPQPKPSSSGPIITGVATTTRPRITSFTPTPTLCLVPKGKEPQETLNTKPLGKMFVICCGCKYWHDLPSRLYEAMALPRKIGAADGVPEIVGAKRTSADTKRGSVDAKGLGELWRGKAKEDKGKGKAKEEEGGKGKAVEGKVYTTVKCPWCEHGMSTACCAGWTTIVYLHERHH